MSPFHTQVKLRGVVTSEAQQSETSTGSDHSDANRETNKLACFSEAQEAVDEWRNPSNPETLPSPPGIPTHQHHGHNGHHAKPGLTNIGVSRKTTLNHSRFASQLAPTRSIVLTSGEKYNTRSC